LRREFEKRPVEGDKEERKEKMETGKERENWGKKIQGRQ
jgi:hypothetical protein